MKNFRREILHQQCTCDLQKLEEEFRRRLNCEIMEVKDVKKLMPQGVSSYELNLL